MDWFLYNTFLLYMSTQSALYNIPHSPIYTHIPASYLTFTHSDECTGSGSGFGILPTDTLACRLEQPGIEPPTLQIIK